MTVVSRATAGREAGNTMVSVIIALAIISVSAAAVSTGYANLFAARRSSAASAAEREMQDAIVQTVVNGYRTYVEAQCSPAAAGSISNLSIGSLATLTATKQIVIPGDAGGTSGGDVKRCAKTPTIDQATAAESSTFYSCYQIAMAVNRSTTKVDKTSFMASKAAFIEVLIHPKDLRTDHGATCLASAQSGDGHGLEIYYSLHWILNSNQGLLYKTRVGSVNVAL